MHRILIKIGEDRALELKCGLSEYKVPGIKGPCLYSYFVKEQREIGFRIPKSDFVHEVCSFVCLDCKDARGSASEEFIDLYERVDGLKERDMTLELNREKDREIWSKYVGALKRIVLAKDVAWKIKSFEYKPPAMSKGNGEAQTGSAAIAIDEGDLNEEFKAAITAAFRNREIQDVEIEGDTASICFGSIRNLADSEREGLSAIANRFFYEFDGSPSFAASADVQFPHDADKTELFKRIAAEIKSGYGLETEVQEDGTFAASEQEIVHIQKVVSEKFASAVELERESTRLYVKIGNPLNGKIAEAKRILDSLVGEGKLRSNNSTISLLGEAQIAVDISAFIKPDVFGEIGLRHVKTVGRYGNGKPVSIPAEGTYIDGNFYCADGVRGKEQSKKILDSIKSAAGDYTIRRQSTRYVFELKDANSLNELRKEALRNFKTKTDVPGKNEFDIATSKLAIFARDKIAYDAILKDVKRKCPNAEIEQKPMAESYKFVAKGGFDLRKKQALNDILNELRKMGIAQVCCDENSQKIICWTEAEDVCRSFHCALNEIHAKRGGGELRIDFKNQLSSTSYAFKKNDELKREYEKLALKNLSRQEFVLLTEDEKKKFDEESSTKIGKKLGTLVKKNGIEMKFKLSESFDEAFVKGEIQAQEIAGLFLKPTFAGELANINRMIRAMNKLTNPGGYNGYPANRGLPDFIFDAGEAREPGGCLEEAKRAILANLNEEKLNERQIEAVAKSLLAEDLAIIQGPPGTGKTTVIAEIIWQTLSQNPEAKILVSSQTNLAVDNALERLKAKKLVRPIRIGNEDKFEDFGKPYSFDRIQSWAEAEQGSREEELNSDNAVANWIRAIAERCGEEEECEKAVEEWKRHLRRPDEIDKQNFASAYIRYVNVFAATCSECGSGNFRKAYKEFFGEEAKDPVFDIAIVDETSKATPPELALPLTLGKKIVLIGDHKQLPPMIDENDFMEALEKVGAQDLVEEWSRKDFQTSQFEKLFLSAPSGIKTSLDTQYRMHGQIMDCVSRFYKGQKELPNGLVCGIKDEMDEPDFSVKASRHHGLKKEPLIAPETHAIWVNVEGAEEKVGTSYRNAEEIEAVKTVITALTKAEGFKEYREYFGEGEEIGVITFYLPQMLELRDKLYPQLKGSKSGWKNFEQNKLKNEFGIPFRINTVDRFQGMERNIVIVSTVRSDRRKSEDGKTTVNKDLGFAKAPARINVAFSRAKRLLVIIGNQRHFSQRNDYREIVEKIRRNGISIDVKQLRNV